LQGILSKFAQQDWWNFDETDFFPFASPDHGLSKQMSRKKKEKSYITISLACNVDGNEKLPP
ncbi:hypothetical protein PAXRUDRAFT_61748, partial [Paxillus rubicundulus Ve08.2h10]